MYLDLFKEDLGSNAIMQLLVLSFFLHSYQIQFITQIHHLIYPLSS